LPLEASSPRGQRRQRRASSRQGPSSPSPRRLAVRLTRVVGPWLEMPIAHVADSAQIPRLEAAQALGGDDRPDDHERRRTQGRKALEPQGPAALDEVAAHHEGQADGGEGGSQAEREGADEGEPEGDPAQGEGTHHDDDCRGRRQNPTGTGENDEAAPRKR